MKGELNSLHEMSYEKSVVCVRAWVECISGVPPVADPCAQQHMLCTICLKARHFHGLFAHPSTSLTLLPSKPNSVKAPLDQVLN